MLNPVARPARAAFPNSLFTSILAITLSSCTATGGGTTALEAVVASVAITDGAQTLSALGSVMQLTADVRDSDGNTMASSAVQWTSSAPTVVSVSNSGLATAILNGSADVTASVGGISGSVAITVAQVGDTLLITAPSDTIAALGAAGRASARVVDANGNALADTMATWSSSDLSILRFIEAPDLFAEANGTTVLSASIGSFTGTLDIVVAQRPASMVLTPPADTLRSLTDSTQLTTVMVDTNGFSMASTPGAWTSMTPGVATVSDSGIVAAVADGVTEIVYAAGSVSGSAFITVNLDQVPASLTVALDLTSLFAEGALVATATLINASGFEVTGAAIDWTPSDPSVTVGSVGVDSLGRATARLITTSTLGSFSIQAQESGTAVLGSTGFTVTAPPAPQGVTIDFETDASGSALAAGASIGSQFSPWGITFRFVDVFAGGGDGRATLLGDTGFRFLDNDRRNAFEFLTGSHEMTFSVDIGTFEIEHYYPPAAVVPAIRAWDALGREISGIVVDKVALPFDWWTLTIHSPVLVRTIKIGPSNGRIRLDNIVY
jgi:Big-like domain-containing protein